MAWAPDYITGTELGNYMSITDPDAVETVELQLAATAASRAVDKATNRQFGLVAAPEERFYTAWVDWVAGRWVVDVDDVQTMAGLVVEVGDLGPTTAYTLEPVNAAAKGRPWERLVFDEDSSVLPVGDRHEISVVARWGWSVVPSTIPLATKLQGSRFHSRRDSPYGIAGSPDTGSEQRLSARADPDVRVMLTSYRRLRMPQ